MAETDSTAAPKFDDQTEERIRQIAREEIQRLLPKECAREQLARESKGP